MKAFGQDCFFRQRVVGGVNDVSVNEFDVRMPNVAARKSVDKRVGLTERFMAEAKLKARKVVRRIQAADESGGRVVSPKHLPRRAATLPIFDSDDDVFRGVGHEKADRKGLVTRRSIHVRLDAAVENFGHFRQKKDRIPSKNGRKVVERGRSHIDFGIGGRSVFENARRGLRSADAGKVAEKLKSREVGPAAASPTIFRAHGLARVDVHGAIPSGVVFDGLKKRVSIARTGKLVFADGGGVRRLCGGDLARKQERE